MWSKALEIASHLTYPIPVVAFALVFAAFVFWLALRSKKQSGIFWLYLVASLVILLLGLSPLIASTYLQSRGVYRISVAILGTDKQVVKNAELTSLPAAQIKKADGAWEVEIVPQTRPADGIVTLTASLPDAHLEGSTKIVLDKDYFPTTTIQLEPMPSVIVRGVVVEVDGGPVSGAKVAIEGYPEIASTNEMGNFQIASHQAGGQQVTVMAQKDGMSAKKTGPAGDGFELVLRKP
jgi:hypothetical protein